MRSFALGLAVIMLVWSPASGQAPVKNGAGQTPLPRIIEMRVGFALVLYAPAEVALAVVGNHNILDVVPARTSSAFALTAKAPGATNLILLGPDGQELYSGTVSIAGRDTSGEISVHNNTRELTGYTIHNCGAGLNRPAPITATRAARSWGGWSLGESTPLPARR